MSDVAIAEALEATQREIVKVIADLKPVADKRGGEVPWERVKDMLNQRVLRSIIVPALRGDR